MIIASSGLATSTAPRSGASNCRPVIGPGDISSLPPGHDGWVVGDEPVVVIDWYGASSYVKGA